MDRTVVALFDDVNTAQRALEELLSKGFDRSDVSIVRTNQGSGYSTTTGTTTAESDASGAAAGAGIGAVLGGIAGLVVGLGVLAIPGIGPVIAAGPLATTLAGAGIGAATGGIIGALTDVGIPEQEAGYYAEGIRRGGTLLTVRADENRVSQATEILNRFSPVDINQRMNEWRSSGWTGYDPNASYEDRGSYQTGTTMGSSQHSGTTSDTGSTNQYAGGQYAGMSGAGTGYTGRFEDYDTDFRNDWQRRYGNTGYGYERYEPAYRYGYEAHNRYQDRGWNDVEPELRTDWQRNHPNDKWEDFKDSIRTGWERVKQGVSGTAQDVSYGARNAGQDMSYAARDTSRDVGRTYDRTTDDMSRSFDRYDPYFRTDWEQSYGNSGYGYERYQPAYMYGYTLANERQYRSRNWSDIEPDARRDWERQHPNDRWDDFKDAVQHAWQRVKSDVKDALD